MAHHNLVQLSTVLALGSAYIRRQHFLSASGRVKAAKALSAPFLSPGASLRWIQFLRSNSLAQKVVRRSPDFAVKPVLKYLNTDYQFADRVRTLTSHYDFVTRQFSATDVELIYFGGGLKLAEFCGSTGTSYKVILGTYSPCHNEGEMVLKIVTSNGDVICFVIFSVGSSVDGKLRVELGAIQGARRQHPALSILAAKDFHSMRPTHLLMAILYSFAQHCQIHSIVCVSTRSQMCYLDGGNASFRTHYDPLWEELDGRPDSSGFYLLPGELSHRAGPKQNDKHPNRHRRRIELKAAIADMMQTSLRSAAAGLQT